MCWSACQPRVAKVSSRRRKLTADERAERRQRIFVGDAIRFGWVMTICTAIWLLSGAGYFWPAWVLLIGGIKLGMQARDAFNRPDPELPAPPTADRDDDLITV